MERATEKELAQIVSNINQAAPDKYGGKYVIEYAYGRPRLCLTCGNSGGMRDVSPRLPRGQMREWLWAFLRGVEAARDAKQ